MSVGEIALSVALLLSLATNVILAILGSRERQESARQAARERSELLLRIGTQTPTEFVKLRKQLEEPDLTPVEVIHRAEKTILEQRPWVSDPPPGLMGWAASEGPDEDGFIHYTTDEDVERVHVSHWTRGANPYSENAG